jgi:hypothetical protein
MEPIEEVDFNKTTTASSQAKDESAPQAFFVDASPIEARSKLKKKIIYIVIIIIACIGIFAEWKFFIAKSTKEYPRVTPPDRGMPIPK